MKFSLSKLGRRKLLVSLVSLVGYIYLVYTLLSGDLLFMEMERLMTVIVWSGMAIIFAYLLHFLAIEYNQYSFKSIVLVVVLAACITASIAYVLSISMAIIVLLLVFHLGIIVLAHTLLRMYTDYRVYSSRVLITHGIRRCMVYITIIVAGLFALTWKSVDINCQTLYSGRERIEYLLPTFLAAPVLEDASSFSSATLGDVLGIQEQDIDVFINDVQLLDQAKSITNVSPDKENTFLFSSLLTLKNSLLTDLAEDKHIINEGFCSLIVEQVQKKKNAPLFMYSTTFLLFFLLYPLLKVVSFSVGIVMFCILHVGFLTGIYRRESVPGLIDTII